MRLSEFSRHSGWLSVEGLSYLRAVIYSRMDTQVTRFIQSSAAVPESSVGDTNIVNTPFESSQACAILDPVVALYTGHDHTLLKIINRTANVLTEYLTFVETARENSALTNAEQAYHDEVNTCDGVQLGRVLAWFRRYHTVARSLPVHKVHMFLPARAKFLTYGKQKDFSAFTVNKVDSGDSSSEMCTNESSSSEMCANERATTVPDCESFAAGETLLTMFSSS